VRRDLGGQAVNDVAGQHDGLLHLIELLGLDGGQRILLCLDRPVLQGQIDLGKGDGVGLAPQAFRAWRCRPAHRAPGSSMPFMPSQLVKAFLRRGVTRTVVGIGCDLDAGLGPESSTISSNTALLA